jgi:hypothetical protein
LNERGVSDGRNERGSGLIDKGRSTSGGCEEYRVGLSTAAEVRGSGRGEEGSCVGNVLGNGLGCDGAGAEERGAAAVVPEAVRICSTASAA